MLLSCILFFATPLIIRQGDNLTRHKPLWSKFWDCMQNIWLTIILLSSPDFMESRLGNHDMVFVLGDCTIFHSKNVVFWCQNPMSVMTWAHYWQCTIKLYFWLGSFSKSRDVIHLTVHLCSDFLLKNCRWYVQTWCLYVNLEYVSVIALLFYTCSFPLLPVPIKPEPTYKFLALKYKVLWSAV